MVVIFIKYILKNDSNNVNYVLNEISRGEYIEKKSRFICYIFNCNSKCEAVSRVEQVKKNHFDAKHVIYIYHICENDNEILKFSDDGEPQGTGTKAILEMIQKEKLINLCVVIVRYFGGILLGAGPLSRAYLKSFKMAYEPLDKVEYINYIPYSLKFNYDVQKDIDHLIESYMNDNLVIVTNKKFNEQVEYNLKVSKQIYDEIIVKFNNIK